MLNFSFVYPDNKGRMIRREVGFVQTKRGIDESKTLQQNRFVIGDYVDISIKNSY